MEHFEIRIYYKSGRTRTYREDFDKFSILNEKQMLSKVINKYDKFSKQENVKEIIIYHFEPNNGWCEVAYFKKEWFKVDLHKRIIEKYDFHKERWGF